MNVVPKGERGFVDIAFLPAIWPGPPDGVRCMPFGNEYIFTPYFSSSEHRVKIVIRLAGMQARNGRAHIGFRQP
jgi:hypothetical protein